ESGSRTRFRNSSEGRLPHQSPERVKVLSGGVPGLLRHCESAAGHCHSNRTGPGDHGGRGRFSAQRHRVGGGREQAQGVPPEDRLQALKKSGDSHLFSLWSVRWEKSSERKKVTVPGFLRGESSGDDQY